MRSTRATAGDVLAGTCCTSADLSLASIRAVDALLRALNPMVQKPGRVLLPSSTRAAPQSASWAGLGSSDTAPASVAGGALLRIIPASVPPTPMPARIGE